MKHVPLPFWAAFSREVRAGPGEGLTLLGEMLDGDPSVVASTWRGGGFTAMFDFPLGFAMNDVFCRDERPARLAAVLSSDRRYPAPERLVTLLDNHDLPRVMSACGGDVGRVRQALAFLFAMRGIPSLTWGTEVGLDGAKEPDNRKSMVFELHPLGADVTFWLGARRAHPALAEGVPVVLAVTADRLVIGRVAPSQLAVVVVGRGDEGLPAEAVGPWARARRALSPPRWPTRAGVSVFVSPLEPGAFEALARQADAQWRGGLTTRAITFEGPEGASVAGSGAELGDWSPARARALPLTVSLPLGAVFEFKALRRKGGAVVWAEGPNGVVHVTAAGPSRVTVPAAFPP
ncbi:MAG: hypothetical protein INH41_28520 [Myxococcaceae bacterium]|nr:hypothetical protein [Myxococcaceae bacterium]MCA3016346.1 hypothetical protein [Myxococcaceae bacterium]